MRSLVLKAKKESSDEGSSALGSEDEEYAMAVRDFKIRDEVMTRDMSVKELASLKYSKAKDLRQKSKSKWALEGFSHKWRKWIHSCLHSAYSSILINGSPTSKFKLHRGLRLGDPFSPLLFILAIEALNVAFIEAKNKNLFHGVEVGVNKACGLEGGGDDKNNGCRLLGNSYGSRIRWLVINILKTKEVKEAEVINVDIHYLLQQGDSLNKQNYQKEVNEIRAEKIARNANPLALDAAIQQYPDTCYQAPKTHKSYAPPTRISSLNKSHATTKHKGKEIAKLITPTSELASRRQTSLHTRNKNVDTSPRYKNDNQTGHFGNQRIVIVAKARETIGNQAEKGILFCAEQTDWLDETDKEELEVHYNFMAKI
nr:cysteine-rich receptor-like protein kinase [Tanacetum cinerariifolium]